MSLETIWKKLLKEIIIKGHEHKKDDSPILEIIGVHEFIPTEFLQSPIYVPPKPFLNAIKDGKHDIKGYPMTGEALHEYVTSIEDQYMIDGGDFIYTYPERLCNYITVDLFGRIMENTNQLELMRNRLENNPGSNRAVAITYNPGRDGVAEDIPCLQFIQALIRDDELTLTVIFRSNDCYGAWPANMLFINYIGLKLVDELRETYPGLTFKGIYYNVSSLHIYETDLDAARKVVGL